MISNQEVQLIHNNPLDNVEIPKTNETKEVIEREYDPRKGPSWGNGPYFGRRVWNKHVGRKMFQLPRFLKDKKTGKYIQCTYIFNHCEELIYTNALDVFVDILVKRLKSDQQTIIEIIGDTGSGKSSLGLNIAQTLQRQLGKKWDIDRDLVLDANDFVYRMLNGKDEGVILMDEAHLILSTDKQSTKEQKDVKEIFVTMRSRHTTTIMCSPTKFTSSIEKDFVDFKLICSDPQKSILPGFGRGFFQCFKPMINRSLGEGKDGVWNQLIFTGMFGDYPEEYQKQYRQMKRQQQQRNLRKLADKRARDDPAIIEYYNLLYDKVGNVPSPYDSKTNKAKTDYSLSRVAIEKYKEEIANGYPIKVRKTGRPGRPVGSKDKVKRVRRTPQQIAQDKQKEEEKK